MRNKLQWASVILYMAVSVFLIAFGLLYANVSDLLWFHAAAVPAEALDKVRPLYFALMKLIGGASIGLGLLGAYVVLGPMRQGVKWAGSFVAVTYLIAFGVAGYTAIRLNELTGAPVAWYNMAILSTLTALAFAAHAAAPRTRAAAGDSADAAMPSALMAGSDEMTIHRPRHDFSLFPSACDK